LNFSYRHIYNRFRNWLRKSYLFLRDVFFDNNFFYHLFLITQTVHLFLIQRYFYCFGSSCLNDRSFCWLSKRILILKFNIFISILLFVSKLQSSLWWWIEFLCRALFLPFIVLCFWWFRILRTLFRSWWVTLCQLHLHSI